MLRSGWWRPRLEFDAEADLDHLLGQIRIHGRRAEYDVATAIVSVSIIDATEDSLGHRVIDACAQRVATEVARRLADACEVCLQMSA